MSAITNTKNTKPTKTHSADTFHEILSERRRKEDAKAAREFAVEFIKGFIWLAVFIASLFIIFLNGGAQN